MRNSKNLIVILIVIVVLPLSVSVADEIDSFRNSVDPSITISGPSHNGIPFIALFSNEKVFSDRINYMGKSYYSEVVSKEYLGLLQDVELNSKANRANNICKSMHRILVNQPETATIYGTKSDPVLSFDKDGRLTKSYDGIKPITGQQPYEVFARISCGPRDS